MLDSILMLIPSAADIFNWFFDNANYWFVILFMVIESSFIPFPSEVVVPPAVYLACTGLGAGSGMNPFVVVLLATAGALIGAYINYYLSVWIGRPVIYKFAGSRIGHMLLLSPEKVDKAEIYFDKHGAISTFIGRLIPAVRQLISIPAGLSRMNVGVFTIYTSLGALLWNIILGLLGWWLSLSVKPKDLLEQIEKYNSYLSYAGLTLGIVCIVYIIYKAIKYNKHTKTNENI